MTLAQALSRATEQYCAAGAILKPLCLSKQLTLCKQQRIDQLFPGHIVCKLFVNYVFLQRTTLFFLQNMCTIHVIIGFARERAMLSLLLNACKRHMFTLYLLPTH